MKENPKSIGTYFYSIDSKNRLAVPVRLRQSFTDGPNMVLCRGLEGCLYLYSFEGWEKLQERLESRPLKNKSAQRAFKRILFASACEVSFDDEGRILMPQQLVEYAKLKKEVAIIGMGQKIEIWSKSVWSAYENRHTSAFSRHAADLDI